MIKQDVVHHENQTRQQCGRLYRDDLRRIRYWTIMIVQKGYGLWQRLDNTWFDWSYKCSLRENRNCHDLSNKIWFITKKWQDNDVIDCVGVISALFYTKLSRLIKQCATYDKGKKRKWRDRLDKFVLPQKQKLSGHDQFDRVWSMMKTRQDIDMTNCISAVYTEIKTELLWLIQQDAIYNESR